MITIALPESGVVSSPGPVVWHNCMNVAGLISAVPLRSTVVSGGSRPLVRA